LIHLEILPPIRAESGQLGPPLSGSGLMGEFPRGGLETGRDPGMGLGAGFLTRGDPPLEGPQPVEDSPNPPVRDRGDLRKGGAATPQNVPGAESSQGDLMALASAQKITGREPCRARDGADNP